LLFGCNYFIIKKGISNENFKKEDELVEWFCELNDKQRAVVLTFSLGSLDGTFNDQNQSAEAHKFVNDLMLSLILESNVVKKNSTFLVGLFAPETIYKNLNFKGEKQMFKNIIKLLAFSSLVSLLIINLTNHLEFLPIISYVVLLIGILSLISGILDLKKIEDSRKYYNFIFSILVFIASIWIFVVS
jgi:hypothetical protein